MSKIITIQELPYLSINDESGDEIETFNPEELKRYQTSKIIRIDSLGFCGSFCIINEK
jgi:hypothetical protein